jgi:general secretion pathway protein L
MLAEAFGWWTARMSELVPEWLAGGQGGPANALVIAPATDPSLPATVFLRRKHQETPGGTFIPDRIDRNALQRILGGAAKRPLVLLRVPPGAVLEKRIEVPQAAASELGRVIGYDLPRITPFSSDEVFWTWAVEGHDRTRGRLQVLLSLVPKEPWQRLLAALNANGLAPVSIEAPTRDGGKRLIPLHPDTEATGWRRHATTVLAGACGVLALVAVCLPFLQQTLALNAVADRIAALQPDVSQVQALRQRIAAETAGRDAIADERARVGDPLGILAAITDLLPDDTFLNDVTLRQRRLTISGQSTAAPKLIAVLAADPMFRNPGFAAPVTRNEVAKTDVFSIRADVGP